MSIQLRKFWQYDYKDPASWLRQLRQMETHIARSGLPYKIRSLRTHRLRKWQESRQAALFSYGIRERCSDCHVDFALVEDADYDAVVRCHSRDEVVFTPVQLKELPPRSVGRDSASLEYIFEKLRRYTDSSNLIVAIHLNRRFKGPIDNLPLLPIGGLYFFGAADPRQRTWQLTGDVLSDDCSTSTFVYPT
jgi:hypothetical protein